MQSNSPFNEEWFSLEGFLNIKWLSGALAFLQMKKRVYCGLDERENKLVYYRDKADFDRKVDRLGVIPLHSTACSLAENSPCTFILHADGKKYMLEAENEKCAECWLNALQRRRDINDNVRHEELPAVVWSAIRRYRSRSRSLPSDKETSPASIMRQRPSKLKRRHTFKLLRLNTTGTAPTGSGGSSPGTPPSGSVTAPPLPPRLQNHRPSNTLPRIPIEVCRRKSSGACQFQRSSRSSRPRISSSSQAPTPSSCGVAESPLSPTVPSETNSLVDADELCAPPQPPPWLENWINGWLNDQMACSGDGGGSPRSRSSPERPEGGETTDPALLSPEDPVHSDRNLDATEHTEGDATETTSRCDTAASSDDESQTVYSELNLLKMVDNRQKETIRKLTEDKCRLESEVQRLQKVAYYEGSCTGGDPTAALTAQNRFLNAEVLRLNDRCLAAQRQIEQRDKRITQLEDEMEDFKKEYVFLLQSCVRIPLHEHSAIDAVQVKLFGGDVHERRVKKLLSKARDSDPTLPTFEGVTASGNFHVDEYGFRHTFEDVPLALHYICTQLNEHYVSQSDDYANLKQKWKTLLQSSPEYVENTHENRQLCRSGIPRSLRSRVWKVLINQQVMEVKKKYGEYYYRNLCNTQGSPAEKQYCTVNQKQINLDLLRTMPTNVHFMSASCKGITHLQAVLRAYCLHNPTLGYCQGMNFLAATALLFVSAEDAFWFLVAITERYFDPSYFDQSLTGAQADQEVLKELVEQRFPKLARHLDECDIDLTTVTLNWFLALFFDAVPFQTMLRIWDCFLLEGPKVLFRFSIALLGLYQDEILDHSETISVMKVLKAAVRLTYDADGLIKFAFEELNPFPTNAQLKQKQTGYLVVLKERLSQRQHIRNLLNVEQQTSTTDSDKVCDLPIEIIAFSDYGEHVGYVCAGNQKRGKLSVITFHDDAANLNTLDLEFDCRPVSMVMFEKSMAFVSLLSGYIVAIHLKENQAQILWELKLNDVALKLIHCENRLYSALANGTLAVLENAFERMPSSLDLYHIPVAAAPITDALIDEEHLYLAVACKIVILNRTTLSTIGSVYVASSAAGSHVPMFEKIRAFSDSEYGIWLITAHSSLIQLWKDSDCQLLYDITYDHSHRKPSFDENDDMDQVEIYSLMYFDGEVWIGTIDGYLMLYRVDEESYEHKVNRKPKISDVSFSLHRYPPGKRLSPNHNHDGYIPFHRQPSYYIPTKKETQVEETACANEFAQSEPVKRKISVKINQFTRQYSVNVEPVRQISSDGDTGRVTSVSTQSSADSLQQKVIPTIVKPKSPPPAKKLHKGLSVDSAVSVFSTENGTEASKGAPLPATPQKRRFASVTEDLETRTPRIESLLNSTSPSLEFDDLFEMYSESDQEMRLLRGEISEETLFNSKVVKIPARNLSPTKAKKRPNQPLTVDCTRLPPDTLQNGDDPNKDQLITPDSAYKTCDADSDSSTPSSSSCAKHSEASCEGTTDGGESPGVDENDDDNASEKPKLRRKDLEFDDPVLVAVKELDGAHLHENPPSRRVSCMSVVDGEVIETEVRSSLSLYLQMKLKISDKPVKCITKTRFNNEDVVISGAGNYGDEEAVLRWRRDKNSGLWINDPLVDMSVRGRKRTLLSKPSIRRK